MDAAILTSEPFWNDPASPLPDIPALAGHVLFDTSGSSGVPKQVAISKKALLVSARAVNQHLGAGPESCWGLVLPLNHVGGFGVAARAYEAGCGFQEFGRRWNPMDVREWLEKNEITHTSLVPTQVHDLVRENLSAPASLKAIVVGGGHLDVATGKAARDLGWPVLASYGMTEASSQVATQSLDSLGHPYQSAPIPVLPIWDVRKSSGDLLELSGPALFSGYVFEGRFSPRENIWHVTTDRVALENRAITPLGRADSLVKVLGELVDPEAIERELTILSHGRLRPGTFAVVAIPDDRAGSALVPVFESSVDQVVVDDTLSVYQKQSPGFRRLRNARIIAHLPRSEMGKIQRNGLASMIHQGGTP